MIILNYILVVKFISLVVVEFTLIFDHLALHSNLVDKSEEFFL